MSFDSPSPHSIRQSKGTSTQSNPPAVDTRRSKEQPSTYFQANLSPLDITRAKPSITPRAEFTRHEKPVLVESLHPGRNPSSSRPRDVPSPGAADQPRLDRSSPTTPSQGLASPTSSSFDKISAAQLSILLDATREKDSQKKWEARSDRIHHLLNTKSQEVLAVFLRKAILFNHDPIFGSESSPRHPSYNLLQEKITQVSQDPIQAFHIVDAIDATRDDYLQPFNLGRFVQHFSLNLCTQLILGIAFTASIKASIREQAEEHTSRVSGALSESPDSCAPFLRELSLESFALLVTHFALSSKIPTGLHRSVQSQATERIRTTSSEASRGVMSASQLWKLPDRDRLIIDAFKRAGPRSAASRHSIDDVLSSLPANAFSPHEISNALLFMIYSQPNQHYNLAEFISALKASSRARQLNWNLVIKDFDTLDLRIPNEGFARLFRALQQVAADNHDFDIQLLWGGRWDHPHTQISFLRSFFAMQDVPMNQIPGFQPAFQLSEFERASSEIRERVATELAAHHNNLHAMKAVFEVILSSDEMLEDDVASGILHDLVNNHLLGFLLSQLKTQVLSSR